MKNERKRCLCVLMCVAMLLTMTACGMGSGSSSQTNEATKDVSAQDSSDGTLNLQTEVIEALQEAADTEAEVSTPAGTSAEQSSSPAVSSDTSNVITGYALEELGSFADQDGMGVQRGIMLIADGDEAQLLYGAGIHFDGTYTRISDLGDGYIAVTNSDSDVNSTGLVTLDGEVLIPCEAALIEWIHNDTGENTGRYLKVIYGTGETTNKDECFFYATDKSFSIRIDDDDIMYTGYAKIYDVQQRCFVGDVESTNPNSYSIKECGNHFTIEDTEGVVYLYDSNGDIVMQTANADYVGNGYILTYDEGSYDVYDENGAYCFSSADLLSDLESTSGFLKKYTGNGYVLLDTTGNQVLPETYGSIMAEAYGMVTVKTDTEAYQLLDLYGNVLATADDYFIATNTPGYFYYTASDGYTLVGPDGIIASGLSDGLTNVTILQNTDALVLNDKTFSLHLENERFSTVGVGLIASKSDSTGKYGLFDLFTGTQLLDYQFAEIEAVDGYVYARQADTWTAYKLTCLYG